MSTLEDSPLIGNSGDADPDEHQVVDALRHGLNGPHVCPDCGADIESTRGQQPLPDGRTTLGWRCLDCDNTFPARLDGRSPLDVSDFVCFDEDDVELRTGVWVVVPVRTGGDSR